MNKYEIRYIDSRGEGARMRIFAMTADDALSVFRDNLGEHPEARAAFLREATEWELEQINSTGAPSPKKEGAAKTVSVVSFNLPRWNVEEETGYHPITTFWQDFSMADRFGIPAVKDTFARAFKEWRANYKYLTELVMVLNHKVWQYYQPNRPLAQVYQTCYEEADAWAMENLKGEKLDYYIRTLD